MFKYILVSHHFLTNITEAFGRRKGRSKKPAKIEKRERTIIHYHTQQKHSNKGRKLKKPVNHHQKFQNLLTITKNSKTC